MTEEPPDWAYKDHEEQMYEEPAAPTSCTEIREARGLRVITYTTHGHTTVHIYHTDEEES